MFVEEDAGGVFEDERDFGASLGEPFAAAEIEGDSGPAPVVDVEAEGYIGLDIRLGGDVFFLAVADDILSVDVAGSILASDDAAFEVLRGKGADRLEDFHFFVADGSGAQ